MIYSILFTIVIPGLIIAGLVLSIIQFSNAFASGTTISESTMQISNKGFFLESSIMGAILLTLSLRFPFLYLRYVFPIEHPVPPKVGKISSDELSDLDSKE